MKIFLKQKKELINYLVGFAVIAAMFIVVSGIVALNEKELKAFIYHHEIGGALAYIILGIVATVIAPLSALPFLPIVSLLYGWFWAAIFSIISWSIGSLIAFWIARKYGKRIVRRFVSLERVEKIEARIPKEQFFWTIVLLRIVIPVDALSYALGLFSTITTREYIFATVIGITPFAFVWAYFGTMTPKQLIIAVGAMVVIYIVLKERLRPHKEASQ
ncbi:MAG: VTT domain-containing protein [Candidatus Azambacteria bacterium]|nr:VTT domain-containing protein [Candidatus Azambacteria bacterium]